MSTLLPSGLFVAWAGRRVPVRVPLSCHSVRR
jgi:hypothetical protein